MRYFYVFLAVLAILVLLSLLVFLIIRHRRKWAREKVCSLCAEEKIRQLDAAMEPFGFCYVERDDSISSRMYPWQRQMGYCKAYDKNAVAMSMVIDCEPIYFNYGGCRYLIEFWKGQYGCTTGAEIGIYVNQEGDFEKPAEELFYECVSDKERLPLSFKLIKDGKIVLKRRAVHWWLTGFLVGMYAKPEELTLKAEVSFPDFGMCNAFYEGLLRAGYERREICVERQTVCFSFRKPHTRQYYQHSWIRSCRRKWTMRRNRRNCKLYCRVTRGFDSTLNRLTFLGYCFPVLYHIMIKLGMKGSRCKRCGRKKRC